ncbi:MAG: hypothetical protein AAGA37_13770 [Actinomycetota bacterium]
MARRTPRVRRIDLVWGTPGDSDQGLDHSVVAQLFSLATGSDRESEVVESDAPIAVPLVTNTPAEAASKLREDLAGFLGEGGDLFLRLRKPPKLPSASDWNRALGPVISELLDSYERAIVVSVNHATVFLESLIEDIDTDVVVLHDDGIACLTWSGLPVDFELQARPLVSPLVVGQLSRLRRYLKSERGVYPRSNSDAFFRFRFDASHPACAKALASLITEQVALSSRSTSNITVVWAEGITDWLSEPIGKASLMSPETRFVRADRTPAGWEFDPGIGSADAVLFIVPIVDTARTLRSICRAASDQMGSAGFGTIELSALGVIGTYNPLLHQAGDRALRTIVLEGRADIPVHLLLQRPQYDPESLGLTEAIQAVKPSDSLVMSSFEYWEMGLLYGTSQEPRSEVPSTRSTEEPFWRIDFRRALEEDGMWILDRVEHVLTNLLGPETPLDSIVTVVVDLEQTAAELNRRVVEKLGCDTVSIPRADVDAVSSLPAPEVRRRVQNFLRGKAWLERLEQTEGSIVHLDELVAGGGTQKGIRRIVESGAGRELAGSVTLLDLYPADHGKIRGRSSVYSYQTAQRPEYTSRMEPIARSRYSLDNQVVYESLRTLQQTVAATAGEDRDPAETVELMIDEILWRGGYERLLVAQESEELLEVLAPSVKSVIRRIVATALSLIEPDLPQEGKARSSADRTAGRRPRNRGLGRT